MGRRAKPSKGKAEAKRSLSVKSPKNEGARVRDLENRLAESLEREKATGRARAMVDQRGRSLRQHSDCTASDDDRLCGLEAGSAACANLEGACGSVGTG
jgi:hypothetical protein